MNLILIKVTRIKRADNIVRMNIMFNIRKKISMLKLSAEWRVLYGQKNDCAWENGWVEESFENAVVTALVKVEKADEAVDCIGEDDSIEESFENAVVMALL